MTKDLGVWTADDRARQEHMEGSAVVPAIRFSPYAAAVCFNDSPGQVEPQAQSVNSLFDGSLRSAITPKQACHLVGC